MVFVFLEVFPIIAVCSGCRKKYPRLGGLNNGVLFCHSSGAWQSEIKVLAALVSSEACVLGLWMVVFPLGLPTVFPLCVCTSFLSYKDTSYALD